MIQTAPSLILVVGVLVTILKSFLELKVPNGKPLHDPTIWLAALAIGIIGSVLDYLVNHSFTGPGLEHAAGSGFSAGIAAVTLYHLSTTTLLNKVLQTTGPLLQAKTPPVDPPQSGQGQ